MSKLVNLIYAKDPEGALKLIPSLSKKEINQKYHDDNFQKYTALHLASLFGMAAVVEALIIQGADLRAWDELNKTPLHYAVHSCEAVSEEEKVTVVQQLHEADPKLVVDTDSDGNSALHIASAFGFTQIVKKLLALGSDPDKRNNENKRASDLVPSDNPGLKVLLKKNEDTLEKLALRRVKANAELKETFLTEGIDVLRERLQLIDEPNPRLVLWCMETQKRAQTEAQVKAQNATNDHLSTKALCEEFAKLDL